MRMNHKVRIQMGALDRSARCKNDIACIQLMVGMGAQNLLNHGSHSVYFSVLSHETWHCFLESWPLLRFVLESWPMFVFLYLSHGP